MPGRGGGPTTRTKPQTTIDTQKYETRMHRARAMETSHESVFPIFRHSRRGTIDSPDMGASGVSRAPRLECRHMGKVIRVIFPWLSPYAFAWHICREPFSLDHDERKSNRRCHRDADAIRHASSKGGRGRHGPQPDCLHRKPQGGRPGPERRPPWITHSRQTYVPLCLNTARSPHKPAHLHTSPNGPKRRSMEATIPSSM